MFGQTITLRCSRWRELRNYSTLFQLKAKLITQIFRLRDQIVETLCSCYDDSPLHSKILLTFWLFQTCVSLTRYTHIFSNHLWSSENNDTRREPQHSFGSHTSVCIISNKSVARSIVPENGVLVILPMRMVRNHQLIHNQVIPKAHQHGFYSCALHQYDLNGSATNKLHYHY